MSNEVVVREKETRTAVEPQQRQQALAQVVEAVREDSQQSPTAFLAETTVPHGGE